ncbi:MAG TPA: TetR/AcrR family transcriptional regulator, partial [Cupriavidus sp.]|nr:TetR/AcrR family transcriptional regulator [Cupriavidus sp.]
RFPEVVAIPDWEARLMFGVYAARSAHFNAMYNSQAPLPKGHTAMVHTLYELVVSYLGLPPIGRVGQGTNDQGGRPRKLATSSRTRHTP